MFGFYSDTPFFYYDGTISYGKHGRRYTRLSYSPESYLSYFNGVLVLMTPKELPFQKKELNVIVFNPMDLPTIDYHKLSILQGSLKTLSETNRTKLCKSILEHGFFIPAFIWRSGEDIYILDATQRYHALEELERKGYTIPDIPYIEIKAKDKKDAAQKLLQITSRYGEINPETSFFEDFDIDIAYLNDIEIPELNIKFEESEEDSKEKEVDKDTEHKTKCPKCGYEF